MKALEGVNLTELLDQANAELLEEGRKGAIQQIKNLFIGEMNLAKEIAELEKKLEGLKNGMIAKKAAIDKIRGGDWSAVPVKVKEEKKDGNDKKKDDKPKEDYD